MDVYVDASTLIALGAVGELDALHVLDSDLVIPGRVREEVATQPARENLQRFLETVEHRTHPDEIRAVIEDETGDRAKTLLDEPAHNSDTELVGGVLAYTDADEPVGVVSDDRRVRTVTEGLGATVTGTIGVVARNVADDNLTAEQAKDPVRRIDSQGLHMTGQLREKAYDLIEDAT